jgi:hypothetical protein
MLSSNAVECWKAALEEFGLLYVPSGSDQIIITPAGHQFREAGERGHEREIAWIGLSLLLRYPLRGPRGRRQRQQAESDLLIYWYLYAAMRQLGNHLWWTELERILCHVFRADEGMAAIEAIMELRNGRAHPDDFPSPIDRRGAFYNSLNQVIVHGSMNYMLMDNSNDEEFYAEPELRRHHQLSTEWIDLIDAALGGTAVDLECQDQRDFVGRMPKAPSFAGDEIAYFEYAGAPVDPLVPAPSRPIARVSFGGMTVWFLRMGEHYTKVNDREISGKLDTLCGLARGQRIILSGDRTSTYIVEDKNRQTASEIAVRIRRARPISNLGPLLPYFEEE